MMFGEAMRRWPFEAIPNCPGRFVARWREKEKESERCERLEEVWPGAAWSRMDDADTRDAVWHHAFADGSGGFVVFQKPDGALVVTLGTAEGFARKMRMLAPREHRWIGPPADGEEDVVLLAVATEAELAAHRGMGLLHWFAVPPEQCFRMDRYTSGRREAAPAVLALLRPGEESGWRLAPLYSRAGDGTHLLPAPLGRDEAFDWTAGWAAFDAGAGLRVAVALLERAGERRCVFVKRWTGRDLAYEGRAQTVAPGSGALRELSAEHLEEAAEEGGAVTRVVSCVELLNSQGRAGATLSCCRPAPPARRGCSICRRCSIRGRPFARCCGAAGRAWRCCAWPGGGAGRTAGPWACCRPCCCAKSPAACSGTGIGAAA